MFAENEKTDEVEIYTASQDTIWGISSEAAVCLVCPEYGRGDFIRSRFCKNFNEQYLFMYVLLLHQKYVLYMFLMKIGIGTYNDLKTLEKYRNELCEFETDFVFSCITEVPQYQNLYERMTQAFSLKRMYEDVHEPLQSLSEIRRMASDKEQKKRDDNVDRALLLLTLLSFFSAQMDGFGFIESFFGWFLSKACVMAVQIVCVIAIFVVFVYVVVSLVRFRKKDPDD